MHKVKKYSIAFLVLFSLFWLIKTGTQVPLPTERHPVRFFSNQYSHKMVMIEAIRSAESSIDLAMFALFDREIIDQLNFKATQIPIRLFYDPKQGLPKLHPNIQTIPKEKMKLMHRKILIVDRTLSFLGSTNFTKPSLIYHKNEMVAFHSPLIATWLADHLTDRKVNYTFELDNHTIQIFLMPNPRALPALIETIDRTTSKIHGALFCLNHPQIIDALVKAQQRGVKVHFILDKGQGNRARNEFPYHLSKGYELMHAKSCQLDRTKVIGSANWTKSGFQSNGEVLVIID